MLVDHDFCHRCHAPLKGRAWTMSMFNRDILCWACVEKEQSHPLYTHACDEERRAVARGNNCFAGIGKPDDL
jgi:hypothetical protein